MTATTFGASLLAEIEVERFDNILLVVRQRLRQQSAQAKITDIPLIDDHLLDLEAENTDGDGQGDFPLSSAPESESTAEPYHPLVLEIIGSHPGSGKTRLLYQIAVEALLARCGEGIVIWIDADGHLDYSTFQTVLCAQVLRQGANENDADRLVAAHLGRLHIFQPQTSQALQDVIEGLHGYLTVTYSVRFYSLRAIILGGLSAFHWEDRREDLDSIPEHLPPGAAKSTRRVEQWTAIVQALRRLQAQFDCIIAATDTALFIGETSSGPQIQKHLPTVWNDFVTIRLLTAREHLPRLEPRLSAEEALKEVDWRTEVLQESRFVARIETAGCKDGSSRQVSYTVHAERVSMQGS